MSDDTEALVERLRQLTPMVASIAGTSKYIISSDTRDPDKVAAAATIERLERERDKAIEVADAETKGVYSKTMLEAADAIADNRWRAIRIAELERDCDALKAALRELVSVIDAAPVVTAKSHGLQFDTALEAARAYLAGKP